MNTTYLISLINGVMNSEEVGVDDLYADCIDIKEGIVELLAEVKRLRQAFLIATGHVGYGNHLGHNELRHALNSAGIDADSLSWADGEWSEEE